MSSRRPPPLQPAVPAAAAQTPTTQQSNSVQQQQQQRASTPSSAAAMNYSSQSNFHPGQLTRAATPASSSSYLQVDANNSGGGGGGAAAIINNARSISPMLVPVPSCTAALNSAAPVPVVSTSGLPALAVATPSHQSHGSLTSLPSLLPPPSPLPSSASASSAAASALFSPSASQSAAHSYSFFLQSGGGTHGLTYHLLLKKHKALPRSFPVEMKLNTDCSKLLISSKSFHPLTIMPLPLGSESGVLEIPLSNLVDTCEGIFDASPGYLEKHIRKTIGFKSLNSFTVFLSSISHKNKLMHSYASPSYHIASMHGFPVPWYFEAATVESMQTWVRALQWLKEFADQQAQLRKEKEELEAIQHAEEEERKVQMIMKWSGSSSSSSSKLLPDVTPSLSHSHSSTTTTAHHAHSNTVVTGPSLTVASFAHTTASPPIAQQQHHHPSSSTFSFEAMLKRAFSSSSSVTNQHVNPPSTQQQAQQEKSSTAASSSSASTSSSSASVATMPPSQYQQLYADLANYQIDPDDAEDNDDYEPTPSTSNMMARASTPSTSAHMTVSTSISVASPPAMPSSTPTGGYTPITTAITTASMSPATRTRASTGNSGTTSPTAGPVTVSSSTSTTAGASTSQHAHHTHAQSSVPTALVLSPSLLPIPPTRAPSNSLSLSSTPVSVTSSRDNLMSPVTRPPSNSLTASSTTTSAATPVPSAISVATPSQSTVHQSAHTPRVTSYNALSPSGSRSSSSSIAIVSNPASASQPANNQAKIDAMTSLLTHGQFFLCYSSSRTLTVLPEVLKLWITPDLSVICWSTQLIPKDLSSSTAASMPSMSNTNPSVKFHYVDARSILSIDTGISCMIFGLAKFSFTLTLRVPKTGAQISMKQQDVLTKRKMVQEQIRAVKEAQENSTAAGNISRNRASSGSGTNSNDGTTSSAPVNSAPVATKIISLHLSCSSSSTLKSWLTSLKWLRDIRSNVSTPFNVQRVAWMGTDLKWGGENLLKMFGIDTPRENLIQLGGGGMANVYLITHQTTLQKFALKVFHAYPEVIRHEIDIMKEIRHSNCISYYGCIPRGQDLYVIMEYADLGSLSDFIHKKAREKMKEVHISYILKQVLLALKYLHSLSILHRDVKAANILLTSAGLIKLTDFGISEHFVDKSGQGHLMNQGASSNSGSTSAGVASPSDSSSSMMSTPGTPSSTSGGGRPHTSTNPSTSTSNSAAASSVGVGGSPLWMSPEALRGLDLSPAADVYSLGITAIEIAEGRPPNSECRTLFAVCQSVFTNPSPSLLTHARSYVHPSELFVDFVDKCLMKEPTERWTVDQLLAHPFIVGGTNANQAAAAGATPSSVPSSTLAEKTGLTPSLVQSSKDKDKELSFSKDATGRQSSDARVDDSKNTKDKEPPAPTTTSSSSAAQPTTREASGSVFSSLLKKGAQLLTGGFSSDKNNDKNDKNDKNSTAHHSGSNSRGDLPPITSPTPPASNATPSPTPVQMQQSNTSAAALASPTGGRVLHQRAPTTSSIRINSAATSTSNSPHSSVPSSPLPAGMVAAAAGKPPVMMLSTATRATGSGASGGVGGGWTDAVVVGGVGSSSMLPPPSSSSSSAAAASSTSTRGTSLSVSSGTPAEEHLPPFKRPHSTPDEHTSSSVAASVTSNPIGLASMRRSSIITGSFTVAGKSQGSSPHLTPSSSVNNLVGMASPTSLTVNSTANPANISPSVGVPPSPAAAASNASATPAATCTPSTFHTDAKPDDVDEAFISFLAYGTYTRAKFGKMKSIVTGSGAPSNNPSSSTTSTPPHSLHHQPSHGHLAKAAGASSTTHTHSSGGSGIHRKDSPNSPELESHGGANMTTTHSGSQQHPHSNQYPNMSQTNLSHTQHRSSAHHGHGHHVLSPSIDEKVSLGSVSSTTNLINRILKKQNHERKLVIVTSPTHGAVNSSGKKDVKKSGAAEKKDAGNKNNNNDSKVNKDRTSALPSSANNRQYHHTIAVAPDSHNNGNGGSSNHSINGLSTLTTRLPPSLHRQTSHTRQFSKLPKLLPSLTLKRTASMSTVVAFEQATIANPAAAATAAASSASAADLNMTYTPAESSVSASNSNSSHSSSNNSNSSTISQTLLHRQRSQSIIYEGDETDIPLSERSISGSHTKNRSNSISSSRKLFRKYSTAILPGGRNDSFSLQGPVLSRQNSLEMSVNSINRKDVNASPSLVDPDRKVNWRDEDDDDGESRHQDMVSVNPNPNPNPNPGGNSIITFTPASPPLPVPLPVTTAAAPKAAVAVTKTEASSVKVSTAAPSASSPPVAAVVAASSTSTTTTKSLNLPTTVVSHPHLHINSSAPADETVLPPATFSPHHPSPLKVDAPSTISSADRNTTGEEDEDEVASPTGDGQGGYDPFSFERNKLQRKSSLNQGDGGAHREIDMKASYVISSHGTLIAGNFAISAQGLHTQTHAGAGGSSLNTNRQRRRQSIIKSPAAGGGAITPDGAGDEATSPGGADGSQYDESEDDEPMSPTGRDHALSKSDLFTLGQIGKGQNGPVLKAIHLPSLTRVALKSIYAHDRGTRHQLLHELTAYLHFDSPYLVTFLGAYYEDSVIYLATEYMDQGSLLHFIKRNGALSSRPRVFKQIAFSCISGLKHMHDHHGLHRDIKPDNILIDHEGHSRIADFGLLKDLESEDGMCHTFMGTLSYLAPERIMSQPYSYPSDVWAMGLCFIYALIGQTPKQSADYFTMMDLITKHPPEPLTPERNPGLEKDLCDFVNGMVKLDAKDRYTCDQLLHHPFLLGYKSNEPTPPPQPQPQPQPLAKQPKSPPPKSMTKKQAKAAAKAAKAASASSPPPPKPAPVPVVVAATTTPVPPPKGPYIPLRDETSIPQTHLPNDPDHQVWSVGAEQLADLDLILEIIIQTSLLPELNKPQPGAEPLSAVGSGAGGSKQQNHSNQQMITSPVSSNISSSTAGASNISPFGVTPVSSTPGTDASATPLVTSSDGTYTTSLTTVPSSRFSTLRLPINIIGASSSHEEELSTIPTFPVLFTSPTQHHLDVPGSHHLDVSYPPSSTPSSSSESSSPMPPAMLIQTRATTPPPNGGGGGGGSNAKNNSSSSANNNNNMSTMVFKGKDIQLRPQSDDDEDDSSGHVSPPLSLQKMTFHRTPSLNHWLVEEDGTGAGSGGHHSMAVTGDNSPSPLTPRLSIMQDDGTEQLEVEEPLTAMSEDIQVLDHSLDNAHFHMNQDLEGTEEAEDEDELGPSTMIIVDSASPPRGPVHVMMSSSPQQQNADNTMITMNPADSIASMPILTSLSSANASPSFGPSSGGVDLSFVAPLTPPRASPFGLQLKISSQESVEGEALTSLDTIPVLEESTITTTSIETKPLRPKLGLGFGISDDTEEVSEIDTFEITSVPVGGVGSGGHDDMNMIFSPGQNAAGLANNNYPLIELMPLDPERCECLARQFGCTPESVQAKWVAKQRDMIKRSVR